MSVLVWDMSVFCDIRENPGVNTFFDFASAEAEGDGECADALGELGHTDEDGETGDADAVAPGELLV
jgi:hypothetical protein